MNRWLYGVSFFLIPFFVQAQWNTSRHYGTGYWTVSDGSSEAACDEAKRGALSTYEKMKKRLVGHPYGWEAKYKLDAQCEVPQAESGTVVVKWWITIDIGKEDKEDKRKACLAKPVVKKTSRNVYKIGSDYYANIDGCQYIATGVIVVGGDGTTAADWKPTGELAEEGSGSGSSGNGEETGSGSGSGENGGTSSGNGSSGNEGTGTGSNGGSGGSSGHSLSKDDVVSAVKMGVSDLPTEIKRSLVEDYNIVDDTLKADEKSKESLKSISDSLGNLLRGAGKFVDPEHAGKYGEGESELDTAARIANTSLGIKEGMWDIFLKKVSGLPNGNGCADFILFEGEIYQIRIGCDKLSAIKSMLSWVMMALTFWYVFISLTSLLRKGGD